MNQPLELPAQSRPFVAAIVAADSNFGPQHAAYAAQFSPELVARVHTSFAAYLLTLTMADDPKAKEVGAEYLAVVERAGLLEAAWCAVGYLRAARIAQDVVHNAQRATSLH